MLRVDSLSEAPKAATESRLSPLDKSPDQLMRRQRVRELLKFEGKVQWQGSLDDLRGREPREE